MMEEFIRRNGERFGLLTAAILLGGGMGTLAGGSSAELKVEKLEDQVHQIELVQRDILGEVKSLRINQEKLGVFAESVMQDRIERDQKLREILEAINK